MTAAEDEVRDEQIRNLAECLDCLGSDRDGLRARLAAVENALRTVPTSWNNEADDYGKGYAAGATDVLVAVTKALRGEV